MGVEHALNNIAVQTIAHRVGSYRNKNKRLPDPSMGLQTPMDRIKRLVSSL